MPSTNDSTSHPEDLIEDMSPQAMADAAFADAMKETSPTTNATIDPSDFEGTMALVGSEVESIIQMAVDATQTVEHLQKQNILLRDQGQSQTTELERLHNEAKQTRETIANLLQAVERSKTETRDVSQTAVTIAHLRAELSHAQGQHKESFLQAQEYQRKNELLQQELQNVKLLLSKTTQAKMQLERDRRAQMALSKSMETSSDLEYYKLKCQQLSGHVQNLNAVVGEKNRQIEQLRLQVDLPRLGRQRNSM